MPTSHQQQMSDISLTSSLTPFLNALCCVIGRPTDEPPRSEKSVFDQMMTEVASMGMNTKSNSDCLVHPDPDWRDGYRRVLATSLEEIPPV